MVILLITIYDKYNRYQIDFPLGWDPPSYVGAANLILEKGPIYWMMERLEFSLIYLLIAFFGFILQNTKLACIIIQILGSFILFYSYSKLALLITNSYRIASITAIVCPFSLNYIYFYMLPSQMFSVALLCILISEIDYILDNFGFRDLKSWCLIINSIFIIWIHSIFSIAPLISIIFLVFLFTPKSYKRIRLLKFGSISLILGLIPQIILLPSLLMRITVESSEFHIWIKPTWDFYISNLISFGKRGGGSPIQFILFILGVFVLLEMLRKEKKPVILGALSLIIFSFGSFTLCFLLNSIWPLWDVFARRSILILPVPLLFGLSLSRLYGVFRDWCFTQLNDRKLILNFNLGTFKHSTFLNKKILIKFFCSSLLIFSSVLIFVPYYLSAEEQSWIPWIDRANYEQILFAKEKLILMNIKEKPIFIFYKMSPSLIDYMQNIISMEVGEHYSYYGKLGFLLSGLSTPSHYLNWRPDEEELWSNYLWKRMVNDNIVDKISSHPIVIISKFYLEGISFSDFEKYYRGNGVYIIPPYEGGELPIDTLICYRDFKNITKWGGGWGFYGSTKDWSKSKYALTFYCESEIDHIPVEIDYPIYIRNESLIVRIHLYDHNKRYSPIRFYLGEDLVYTFNYSGTEKPLWIEFPIKSKYDENLRIITGDTLPQYINLDVIYIYIDDNCLKMEKKE